MFHDQHRKFRPAVARRAVSDAVRLAVPACRGVSGDDALDDLILASRDERGLAAATLAGRRRSLTPFLAWLAARGRSWQDAALEDVTAYLASRPHWSRVTISRHVQCLRSFFRHAAMRGWVRPGLAETIDAPRLYTHGSRLGRHDQRVCRSGSGDEGPDAGRVRIVHSWQCAHAPLA
jgi:hypothetical protein